MSGAGIGICGAGGILEVGRWLGEIVEADRAAGPFKPVRQFAQLFMATGLQGGFEERQLLAHALDKTPDHAVHAWLAR